MRHPVPDAAADVRRTNAGLRAADGQRRPIWVAAGVGAANGRDEPADPDEKTTDP